MNPDESIDIEWDINTGIEDVKHGVNHHMRRLLGKRWQKLREEYQQKDIAYWIDFYYQKIESKELKHRDIHAILRNVNYLSGRPSIYREYDYFMSRKKTERGEYFAFLNHSVSNGSITEANSNKKRREFDNQLSNVAENLANEISTQISTELFEKYIHHEIKRIAYHAASAIYLSTIGTQNRAIKELLDCSSALGSLRSMSYASYASKMVGLQAKLKGLSAYLIGFESSYTQSASAAGMKRANQYNALAKTLWTCFLAMEDHDYLLEKYKNSANKLGLELMQRFKLQEKEKKLNLLNVQHEWIVRSVISKGKKGFLN